MVKQNIWDSNSNGGTDEGDDEINVNASISKSALTSNCIKLIQVFKGGTYLKIKNTHIKGKIYLRILDEFGFPIYLRQLNQLYEDITLVDISGWYIGVYTIIFTAMNGDKLGEGNFEIKYDYII